jgi:hypothetical protein
MTTLGISVDQLNDDDGNELETDTRTGAVTVGSEE